MKLPLLFGAVCLALGNVALQAQTAVPVSGSTPSSSAPTTSVPSASIPATPAPSTPAAKPNPPQSSTSEGTVSGYVIDRNDVLDVYVYEVPELSRTYTVTPDGTIIVPLLPEPLHAAGLTTDQLARSMEEAFRQSGRLRRPEVAITIRQSRSLTVTVDGAVRSPQVIPVIWRTKLVDILSQCGGPADDAGPVVTITRGPLAMQNLAKEGGVVAPTVALELRRAMDGADPTSTVGVWPGDRISVNRAGVFYILGNVRSPGGYALRGEREDLTVLRALALAGDVAPNAKKSKAMIIRVDPKAPNGRMEIALDLHAILVGHSPDPKLQANDILYVPTSKGKQALHTLAGIPAGVVGSAADTAVFVH